MLKTFYIIYMQLKNQIFWLYGQILILVAKVIQRAYRYIIIIWQCHHDIIMVLYIDAVNLYSDWMLTFLTECSICPIQFMQMVRSSYIMFVLKSIFCCIHSYCRGFWFKTLEKITKIILVIFLDTYFSSHFHLFHTFLWTTDGRHKVLKIVTTPSTPQWPKSVVPVPTDTDKSLSCCHFSTNGTGV